MMVFCIPAMLRWMGAGFREGLFDGRDRGGGGGQQAAVDIELIGYRPAINVVEKVGYMLVENDRVFLG